MKQLYKLFSPKTRQMAIDAIREAPEHFVVEIKPRTRSLDQNAMLWRLLTIVSKSVPWVVNGQKMMLEPEDWKDIFTAGLHQENRLAKGIRGGVVCLGLSTSKMSVGKMTELIEFIYAFMAEQGLEIDLQEQEIA
jgi:hypothetical protein